MIPTDLNFDRADFSTDTPEADCAWCTRGLHGSYFDVQGTHVCGVCAEQARQLSPQNTRATFLRSFGFGSLAAAVTGFAYFVLFRITDGDWMVFASIGVGYIIGKSMRSGSHGVGGRRYQVGAALLTYAAVILGSSAALLHVASPPMWAYPFLLLTPILNFILGHVSLGALQILFVAAGIRYAWVLLRGSSLQITGPHQLQS